MLYYLRCHMRRLPKEKWDIYESKVLDMYLAIIEYLQKMRKHDLENDLKLLKDESLSWGMRMAIVYRSEKTKILKS